MRTGSAFAEKHAFLPLPLPPFFRQDRAETAWIQPGRRLGVVFCEMARFSGYFLREGIDFPRI